VASIKWCTQMSYSLSILDKSPIPSGATATEALANTVALARLAEQLGYHRFWVAEHHSTPLLASSAPEVLISHILAHTSRIRVGSGGVMLQHYSPYKVAETFNLLAALAPGRVDLGVGKAPGGLPYSTLALQHYHDAARKPDFAVQLAELDAFLSGGQPDGHPLAGAQATPQAPVAPGRFLLGGSPDSARLAARLGWEFAYAGHFNGDPLNIQQSIAVYRQWTGKVPALALYAFVAETREQAQAQVGELKLFKVTLEDGRSVNVPTLQAAEEFARQAGVSQYRLEEKQPHVIAGTAGDVRAELDSLHQSYGIREFIIDIPVAQFALRRASISLLAEAREPLAA
jgi:luciferase family oxidoreductase group 1